MTAAAVDPVPSDPWFDKPKANLADRKEAANAEVGKALNSQVAVIERSDVETTRRDQLLFDLQLYYGTALQSLYQGVTLGSTIDGPAADSVMFNVCYSITNTIRNRICSFRPRAQFLPNGGDYMAQDAASDMTDMSDAWAVEVGAQAQASLMFRDLLTGDGGVLKVYKEDRKVMLGRFPSWEFYFDQAESIYGKPECAYHVTYMPLEQAAARYSVDPFLLATQVVENPPGILYVSNRQMVRITEAWKNAHGERPTGIDPKAYEEADDLGKQLLQASFEQRVRDAGYEPGRHVVTVGEQTVTDEEWCYDAPPLIVRTFDENPVGMWGVGPVRMLRADQIELLKEQESLRIAHEKASKMVAQVQENEDGPTKINNDWVRIERYKNTPAVYTNPAAVNQEEYKYIDVIWSKAYDKIGISQFLAAGTKQPGATSAVAIDASSDLQSDRLALCSQIWEGIFVETAKWWWRFTKELARAGVKPKWRAIQRGVWRELVFNDLDSEYEIRAFPSSLFGQTVSGRLNKAMEVASKGWIDREDALQAIDVPDLSPITDLILAPRHYMQALVDKILRKGQYDTPSPYIDPAALQQYARNRYLQAMCDESNYPQENLGLLRRLIDSLSPPKTPETMAAATSAPGPSVPANVMPPAAAAPAPTGPPIMPAAAPELTAAQANAVPQAPII